MATALVTGASSGMGKEIAKRLTGDGYHVYGAARRVERMADLEDLGVKLLAMDVTDEGQIASGLERIAVDHGGVDVLVNNAGFGSYGAMEDTSPADAHYQMEVNLLGPARITQLVLPHMREKRFGKIVNVSSMGGKIYTPLGSWYHASKHALEGWSDCLRLELAPFGIDVIVVEPGVIDTSFGEVMAGPLLERSGEGPYSAMAHAVAAMTARNYAPGAGSPPSVVAEAVSAAIRSSRPRTRYAVGKYARLLLALRRFTPDRVFDRVVARSAA